jgi:DNA polymerase III alpha subunit
MRTQTLIRSVLRTVGHIAGILENVAEALGNLSVSQTFGESQAKLQQLLVEANVTRTAFERAKSLEGAETGVLLQGLHNINEALLADHPRR